MADCDGVCRVLGNGGRVSKNTPSAGKGWRDKGHSQAYLDGHELAFGKKPKRKSWREICEEGWREAAQELTHLFDKPKGD